ncbi:MAG TPA: hypothetical protein VJR71_14640 [Pseudolabrys sp.]|nr:hypothetical protein [Pseudolabrys sp.]
MPDQGHSRNPNRDPNGMWFAILVLGMIIVGAITWSATRSGNTAVNRQASTASTGFGSAASSVDFKK